VAREAILQRFEDLRGEIDRECWSLIQGWDDLKKKFSGETYTFQVRGREISIPTGSETLSGTRIPKVVLPRFEDWGAILEFQLKENVPGSYPYTAGVYPFKRQEE
ncbi:MAG: hypothetical protein GTO29_02135, partial [Candidatus Latescibacteria bacterium]|nr:hypothetical protein [Candidatus Latescibacterota bacterium]